MKCVEVHRPAGFTLVELLIAITVSVIVFAACAASLGAAARAWAAVASASDEDLLRLEMMIAMQRDAAAAAPFLGIEFSGGSSAMSFAALSAQGKSEDMLRPQFVTWSRNADGRIVRTSRPAAGAENPDCELEVKKVYCKTPSFALRFAGRRDSSENTGETPPSGERTGEYIEWFPEWEKPEMPRLVELSMDGIRTAFPIMAEAKDSGQ